jgi:signal transduction histidine kinase
LSVVLVILTFLWAGESQMLNETRSRNLQIASIVSKDINAQVNGILSDAKVFTSHLETLGPDLDTQATAMLALRISAPQRYHGIYYYDGSGNLLLYLNDSLPSLLQIKDASEIVSQPPVALDSTITAAYSAANFSGYYVSDAHFTTGDSVPVFYVSQSVEFPGGVSRIVVLEIDLQDIWQRIASMTIGHSGYTYVITDQGLIVAHPDPTKLGQLIPSVLKPLTSGSGGWASYKQQPGGKAVLAAYSPVGQPTGWGVLVVQDESELNSAVVRTGAVVVGIWLLLAMIGTVSILWMVGKFTGPIVELTRTTHDIARTGDLKKTAMNSSHDEVGQLSLAFDNMIERLQNTEGRLEHVAEEERTRLARDLHDAVSQTLFSVSLIAEVLPRIYERDPEQGKARLEELRQLTRGALAEMRTLLLELRPASLAEANLPDLLKQLAEAVTGRARIPVELRIEGCGELPTEVRVAFYRISQEALNNVAKHSGATHAILSVSCHDERVRLTVEDDGSGFDSATAGAGQLGLGIMRERAEAVGAILQVDSKPGEGTTVVATWRPPTGTD